MIEHIYEILVNEIANRSVWVFGIVFLGGILTSLSPCVLTMLPIIVAYIGISRSQKLDSFIQSLFFVIGFSLVLMILGLIAATAGGVIGSHVGTSWYIIMGAAMIFFGLVTMHIIHIPLPNFIKEIPSTNYGKFLTPLILGMTFGLVSSPCATPILGGIMAYVAFEGSSLYGAALLLTYALGQGIILIAAGVFTSFLEHLGKVQKYSGIIVKISGGLLILVGLYILYTVFF